MSLTVDEFVRQIGYLPAAYPWRGDGEGRIIVSLPSGRTIRVACHPLPPTRLGSLLFPATRVSVRFDDACSRQERRQFIDTLRRTCQRGGG